MCLVVIGATSTIKFYSRLFRFGSPLLAIIGHRAPEEFHEHHPSPWCLADPVIPNHVPVSGGWRTTLGQHLSIYNYGARCSVYVSRRHSICHMLIYWENTHTQYVT